jgi:hypothetical protein
MTHSFATDIVPQGITFIGASSDAVLVGYDDEFPGLQLLMYLNSTDYGVLRDWRLFSVDKAQIQDNSAINFSNDILTSSENEPWLIMYGLRTIQFIDFGSNVNEFSYRMLHYASTASIKHTVIGSTANGSNVFTAKVIWEAPGNYFTRISKHSAHIATAESIYQL